MPARKRGRQEMEAATPEQPQKKSLLERIRNTWEFANLAQWIFIFGRAVKIDENLDIEELEIECLKSHSTVLPEIGLALLKFVSSHRGLTPEIFDEYTRRQYVAKAPHRNPFGIEEEPAKFIDFDVFTKLRVLQQLTQWTMRQPDRIRGLMDEQKEPEQTSWRIEPLGWDSEDRSYFVLDDNRLYRRTDPPPPPPPPPAPKPKKNSKKARAALRASKRRKLSEPTESETEHQDLEEGNNTQIEQDDDNLGGMVWECVAITLDEYNRFIASFQKSRDPNEKVLRKRVIDDILPLLEKQEEARKRKAAQKEKELLNMEKLALAKRSSRIRDKLEHQKIEEEAREAERKKQADLIMARKEQEKWQKLEKERESRMITREQRLKEREARRILHEEELANLSEDSKKVESGSGRLSERHLKAEIERKKQALVILAEEEEDWIFDCICGAYGQVDDGTHSIACDKCNIWQHSKCVGVSVADAERDDFSFICTTCIRRARDAERAKTQPPIKIKINRPGSSSSSAAPPKENGSHLLAVSSAASDPMNENIAPSLSHSPAKKALPQLASWSTGPSPKAVGEKSLQNLPQPTNGVDEKPEHSIAPSSTDRPNQQQSSQTPMSTPYQSFSRPQSSHAFSSPHPQSPTNLPPPSQPRAYNQLNGYPQQSQNGQPVSSIGTPNQPQTSINQQFSPGTTGSQRPNGISYASVPMYAPQTPASVLQPSRSPSTSFTGSLPPLASSPQPLLSPSVQVAAQSNQDPSQAAALPPSSSGISPTKHSPPRPTTSNGSFTNGTPSALPPMTSLSPNSHVQNLTPPVKLFGNGPSWPSTQL